MLPLRDWSYAIVGPLCVPMIYNLASSLHTNMKIHLPHNSTIDKRPFLFGINKRDLPLWSAAPTYHLAEILKGDWQATSYVLIKDGTSL